MATESVVAIATFEAEVDGEPVLVHAGDVHSARSAVVKGREELFVPVAETAAPKRRTRRT
jgi:hypothetical protein